MATSSEHAGQSLPQETTPLLIREEPKKIAQGNSVLYRLLFCGFATSLSFGVTQIPITYAIREMSCDAYYEKQRANSFADRCAVHAVQARMAREIVLLASSTMVFGLVNLLVTNWTIKQLGVKRALLIQVFVPAVRLSIQNVGIMIGGNAGIITMQCSQIATIIGGPVGYILCLNSFVTDTVSHEKRTASLGRLSGSMMVGGAFGFLVGGMIGNEFGVLAPFRVTLGLFLSSCIYIAICLPATPVDKTTTQTSNHSGLMRYFGPLRIFAPQKWTTPSGRTSTQLGALTLGIGVFLGILATGSLPTLLQLYAIDEFGFSISANGWLIFMYSLLRGLYLTLVFPRVISWGRSWYQPNIDAQTGSDEPAVVESIVSDGHASPREINLPDSMENEAEPLNPERDDEKETFAFDLLYARCSLIADCILTGCIFFVSEGWELFVIAGLLPLSAGTGSAAKGSLLQMISNSERVDALSGITLVENIARLMTSTIFGLLFAEFAESGKTHWIFVCNASVAVLGVGALFFSHFPPKGSTRVH